LRPDDGLKNGKLHVPKIKTRDKDYKSHIFKKKTIYFLHDWELLQRNSFAIM